MRGQHERLLWRDDASCAATARAPYRQAVSSPFGEAQSAKARLEARAKMSDFRGQIRITPGSTFSPEASVVLHEQAVEWLTFKLRKEPFAGKTVVVTHHGHKQSTDPRYAHDLLSASFLSDLEPLLGFSALWIHGHTHTAFNYTVHDTRVICNPVRRSRRPVVRTDRFRSSSRGFDIMKIGDPMWKLEPLFPGSGCLSASTNVC